ncbi:MAG: glycosyltransferase [Allorhizobium sp.]
MSSLEAEARMLRRLGISKPWIARMAARALANGTTIERELLFGGGMQESAYYAGLARLVGLPYLNEIAPHRVVHQPGLDTQLRCPTMIRLSDAHKPSITVIAPEVRRIQDLVDSIARLPGLRDTLAIASPSTIRQAAWQAGGRARVQATVQALFETSPSLSARIVLAGRQGFYLGVMLTAAIALFLYSPDVTTNIFHIAMSLIYLAALLLRAAALLLARRGKGRAPPQRADGPLPIYSVMVALYREAAVAEQLIKALNRLDWPHACLDIKLVCEADDVQTIAAIRAVTLGAHYEIVEVPAMAPRTKPKALTYALNGARGAYVAIYDAEDRPHPAQLREAHARFVSGPSDVACLQAPLIISNAGESWISALFSLEYSALFRRLLPALARYRLPLPLGGTSNHFRGLM